MEKIIKRTISLTTKKRDSRNKLFEEFYSHDKNNAVFEFTVENGIPTEDIVVLFHFKRTNRHLEVRGRVDNDKIIVNFDTSLIIKDEQVAGYIYYENGEKSNDVYRFMFDVHVSEIDKERDLPVMEMESKRIVPLTDIVTKSEITELLKKIVANERLYDDTEIKQQIELKADKETVQAISSKVEALEHNSGNSTTYDDAEIRGQIATKADTQSVEAIAQRVQTLENKTDNDTVYNDTELRQAIEAKVDKQSLLQYSTKNELKEVSDKVQQLENRPQVDISGLATKQEVEAISKVNVDNLVTKDELAQKGYLTTHQSLENLVTKQELEAKGYLTTHQDLSEYAKKAEIPPQFDSKPLTDRIESLETKAISNGAYNDKPLLDKIHEVQESLKGFITQSSRYLTEHQSLAHLVTKDELASKGYITTHQSLEHLVTKEELEQKGYLKTHQSLENVVTKDELNSKGYLTAHQDISNLATNAKVEAVETRVQTLENKPPVDLSHLATKQELEEVRGSQPSIDNHNFATKEELEAVRNSQPKVDTSNFVTKEELHEATEIDYSQIVTHEELEAKHYLQIQSLEGYAKKTEIPKIDTSSFVTKQELEEKQYLKDHQPLDGYVKKSELPTPVDTSTLVSKQELTSMNLVNAEALGEVSKKILEQTTKITALESKSEFEIHGTGMPNGKVTAPIGTTYVDTAVTNGALKWIKQTGSDNTGWKVIHGDTGWRNLKIVSQYGNSYVKIRRVNNNVMYHFGSLENGYFGTLGRNDVGVVTRTEGKSLELVIVNVDGIPQGFRTENSVSGTVYYITGSVRGVYHVRGTSDGNFLSFKNSGSWAIPPFIYNLMININYITEDEWPTELPTVTD